MSSMSMGAPALRPRPPDKGSFPIDRDGQCTELMQAYMKCLKENNSWSVHCRDLSKQYLSCRMDNNLMVPETMERLGFGEKSVVDPEDIVSVEDHVSKTLTPGEEHVAGMNIRGNWFTRLRRRRREES
eukprot:GILK01008060.1.p1 GENE.GILK01008060.1~~GILK01008060.1.p1  ORF type:complete len:128 (+),score=5.82 GILK01008060.1:42-425(+)